MKYKWKHRVCAQCGWLLKLCGAVTGLGRGLTENLETAGGNCGIHYLYGLQLPPPESKWSSSVPPQGALKIRAASVPWVNAEGKRWIDLEKKDLNRLLSEPPPRLAMGRLVGTAIAGATPYMSLKTNYNRLSAISCRMFRSVPTPRMGLWSWAATFKREVLPFYDHPPPEMSDEDWLSSMPKERQVPLRRAMEMWKSSGWSKKYALFSVFIKEELLAGFGKDDDGLLPLREMVARLIYGPHDVTHCIAGPKIKPYLDWLKKQWHPGNYLFYGSTTPEKLQQWLDKFASQGERLYFWSDYSQFEATHSGDTWEFIEHFYRQFAHDRDFQRVLRAWRVPCGVLGDIKFTGRIMNASGRDDTAFANAVLNGFAMVLSVTSAWCKVPLMSLTLDHLQRTQEDLMLSVCGDDALGSLPWMDQVSALSFLTRARENLTSFGFIAKMFCSDKLEDAVYLGHRPICIGSKWYWSRTLGRCLYKLGYQTKVVGDPGAHFMGICQMHMVCSKHVPVLSDICRAWLKSRAGAKVNAYVPDSTKPWLEMGKFGPSGYDDEALESLARAYTVDRRPCRMDLSPRDVKVTSDDFRDLIGYINGGISGIPCVLDHWLLRHMVWVDEQ